MALSHEIKTRITDALNSGRLGAALATLIDGLFADNTDVVIGVDLASRFDVSGTWTLSRTGAALFRLRRSAAAAVEVCAFRFSELRQRTTSSKGLKITGAKIKYTVSTADLNDLTVSGSYSVMPATGAAVAAATSLGTVTYDSAHDTTAERKAQGEHTMTVTFGTPVWLNSESEVELLLTADGTASGVLDVWKVELLSTENLLDQDAGS